MEMKKPKVQESDGEPNKPSELMILANNLFNRTDEGKKLLGLLKSLYVSDKYHATVIPTNPQMIQQFGSVEIYMAFKEGQKSVIFYLEHMIEQYKQLEANQTKKQE